MDKNKHLNDWKDHMCGRVLHRMAPNYVCKTIRGVIIHTGAGCNGCPYQ